MKLENFLSFYSWRSRFGTVLLLFSAVWFVLQARELGRLEEESELKSQKVEELRDSLADQKKRVEREREKAEVIRQREIRLAERFGDLVRLAEDRRVRIDDLYERGNRFEADLRDLQNRVLPPKRADKNDHRLVIDGRIVKRSLLPRAGKFDYSESIAIMEVEPVKTFRGNDPGSNVIVGQWVRWNNQRLPADSFEIGQIYRFALLASEVAPESWKRVQVFDSVGDFGKPFYYTSLEEQLRLARLNRNLERRAVIQSQHKKYAGLAQALGYADLDAWHNDLTLFRASLLNQDSESGWRIDDPDVRYIRAEDLSQPPPGGIAPAQVLIDLANQLESRGIDFIYASIPSKAEIFPELFGTAPKHGHVTPQLDELLAALLDAGVEVLDLRNQFLLERTRSSGHELYLRQDPHISGFGARVAGEAVGHLLKRYKMEERIEFQEEELLISYREKGKFAHQESAVFQVQDSGGSVYENVESAPILILGDSNTYFWDDLHASGSGISAHTARCLGQPVSLFTKAGLLPHHLLREDTNRLLGSRYCVVLLQTSWSLWDLRSPWLDVDLDLGGTYEGRKGGAGAD